MKTTIAEIANLHDALEDWGTLSADTRDVLIDLCQDVVTDYLALRAIAEALAARSPYVELEGHSGSVCEWCYQQAPEHLEWCGWLNAHALVGPASGARTEANPLEFEGVGEERS